MTSAFSILSGLVCGLAVAGLSACDQFEPYECDQQVRHCVRTDAGDVQNPAAPTGRPEEYEIRLSNTCHYNVDVKLCFEVPDGTPDCREFTLRPNQVREERTGLVRFTGRSRLHVRREDEARACRFPLTQDVTFEKDK